MKLTIDGREIEAAEGETVLRAALRHGIHIPHFCWHAKLSIAGSCRMCLVKVNELPKLQPACNVAAAPKMQIDTRHEQVQRARAQVMEFLLLNHPVDCGICDKAGECRLQDYQHRHGAATSRSQDPKRAGRKLQPLGDRILLDNERCILCSRCVRFTREVSRTNQLGIVGRGSQEYVDVVGDGGFDDPYSGNVVDLCPTGALLSRSFLYRCRVWFLEPVRSVCTGCSRACSLQVWRKKAERHSHAPGAGPDREVYRITAQAQDDADGSAWLCNRGFDQHVWMKRPRLAGATVAGRPAASSEALAELRRLLMQAHRPAVLVSTHASNEEVEAVLARLPSSARTYVHTDRVAAPGEIREDDLLIRADKNPNRHGVARRVGLDEFDPGAGHDLVIVWGEIAAAPSPGTPWIHLTPVETPSESPAAVAIPIANVFERSGTMEDFEGRTVAFDRVFAPPAHVHDVVAAFSGPGA
jgi:NADH-quinone oxidoreductase subunit G